MLMTACLYILAFCSGLFGWLLKGFFDRRMRPTLPEPELTVLVPLEVCNKCLARKWSTSLGLEQHE